MLVGLLGRRATGLYLAAIAVVSVICGLALDAIYLGLGVSAAASIGQAAEIIPSWLTLAAAILLLLLSIRPLYRIVRGWLGRESGCGCSSSSCATGHDHHSHDHDHGSPDEDCGCGGACSSGGIQPLIDLRGEEEP